MLCNIFPATSLLNSHEKVPDGKRVRNIPEISPHTRHGSDGQEAWPGRTRNAARTNKNQASDKSCKNAFEGKAF